MLTPAVRDWWLQAPGARAIRLSRQALALSALIAWIPLVPVLRWLLEDGSFRAPRVAWWVPTPWVVGLLFASWVGGALWTWFVRRPGLGSGLIALGVGGTVLLDHQIFGNHLIILVIVASVHTAVGAIQGERFRRVSAAPLRVVQWLAVIVFAWTAVAKINPVFLSGAVMGIGLNGGLIDVPKWLLSEPALAGVSKVLIVAETALAVALLAPPFRRTAVLAALGVHAGIVLFMSPTMVLVAFSLAMGSSYALLYTPWHPVPDID